MADIRGIIAENIAALRKSARLTQAELAERLNYSDKAISKWERGDSIPDVIVLSELASLFSVTVDYFLHEHPGDEQRPRIEANKRRLRVAVAFTSCVAPYVIAVILCFLMNEIFATPDWLWKIFIAPLPVVSILALIFCALWANHKTTILLAASAILWTALLTAFVFLYELTEAWFLFIIGIPLQVIIFFWLFVVRKNKY